MLNSCFNSTIKIIKEKDLYKKIFLLETEEDYHNFLERQKKELNYHINCAIDIICEKIIPKALKNRRLKISSEEFEEMLSLMTYQNSSIIKHKKTVKQIKKNKKETTKKTKIIH